MGRLMGRRHLGEAHHLRNRVRLNRGLARGASLVSEQAIEPFGHEPLLPTPDTGLRLIRLAHDRRQRHDPRPPHMLLRRVLVRNDGFKPTPCASQNRDGYSYTHTSECHDEPIMGIPMRTLLFQLIH